MTRRVDTFIITSLQAVLTTPLGFGLLYSRVLVKVGLKQEMLYSSVMFCSCVAQIVICGTNMIHVCHELTLFAIIYN